MTNVTTARSIIREKAFQALYLLSNRQNISIDEALTQTLDSSVQSQEDVELEVLLKSNMPEAYKSDSIVKDALEFLNKLVYGVDEHKEKIDETISKHLKNRSLERIERTNHIALKIAIYELMFDKSNAPSIVLDEAIELTKRFNDDSSGKFVNGVLQSVLNDMNEDINSVSETE